MEKSTKRNKIFCKRLLVIAFLIFEFVSPLFSRPPSWHELSKLVFRKEQEYFFTASDCPFYIDIRDVKPENVQVSVNSLPENVSFVSAKKEALIPSQNYEGPYTSGTHLVVNLRFAKPGRYRLRYVDVVVNGMFLRLKFENVEVFENPRFILPNVSVKFENENLTFTGRNRNQLTVNAGEHIVFTLYAQYSVMINGFSWNIPEDSLFKQLRTYDSFKNLYESSNSEFTTEKFPLATFDWQPLVKGTYSLPEFIITSTAYNGSRYDLKLPSYTFKVVSPKSKPVQIQEKSVFAYAFSKPAIENSTEEKIICSEADLLNLLELHKKERYSIPFLSSVSQERKEAELKLGLNPQKTEPSVPLCVILISLTCIFLFLLILFLVLKKYSLVIVFSVFFAAFFVFSCVNTVKINKKLAIYKGGYISPIPEETVTKGVLIRQGNVVTIEKKAGKWNYIKHNDTYGWIQDENLYLIK